VAGTGVTRFFAVTVGPDGTVWAGGEGSHAGTLVQLAGDGQILRQLEPALTSLPAGAQGRIEDLAVDAYGRLHGLFLARINEDVVGGGDVVLDPQHPTSACQTVNVFAAPYPLVTRPGRRVSARGWWRRPTGRCGSRAPMAGWRG